LQLSNRETQSALETAFIPVPETHIIARTSANVFGLAVTTQRHQLAATNSLLL